MHPDQYLVLGLFLAVIAIPAIISAYSDSRPPRVGAVVAVAAAAVLLHGNTKQPGGYRLTDIPTAVYGVIGEMIR
ncbi:hypothetical protein M4578_16195 [Salipiger sp. P9]|uniref:hypothetical protein n=1 Tax=Salipiger pentaromativorans TaxID=2943193 RepID=UPI0021572776|nr:hypothetical protein [Salipiger pentaromativorans]MCR8549373.1 hypothetical protein [Salipiger pentaromativorans]